MILNHTSSLWYHHAGIRRPILRPHRAQLHLRISRHPKQDTGMHMQHHGARPAFEEAFSLSSFQGFDELVDWYRFICRCFDTAAR